MNRKRQFAPASQGKRQVRIGIAIVLIAGLIAIPAVRTGVRVGTRSVGIIVTRAAHGVGTFFGSITTVVTFKSTLQKQNLLLTSQVDELTARLHEHDVLLRQNNELKTALNRGGETHFILASIISKFENSMYDTFIIDGGSKAGLAEGQVVYAYGQTPIGHIVEVFPNTATVKLFSTPGEKYEARLSPSGIDVTLVGRGGGNFETTVPHDLAVSAQSVVVSKELRSHVVAVYKKITSDARDPFQTLLLVTPVNIHQLSFVEVAQ